MVTLVFLVLGCLVLLAIFPGTIMLDRGRAVKALEVVVSADLVVD